ncbi:MAG: SpoIID/LytB domain-containing protein [Acidimicrobiia bacterium]
MASRSWLRALVALLVVVSATWAAAPAAHASGAVPVLVLDGTGWGHGVGLSQWGAEYLARTGRSASDILATFYPGAQLATAQGTVRVAVHTPSAPTTTLTFPQGGQVRSPLEGPQSPGFPLDVPPGGRVRVTFDGQGYRVDGVVAGQSDAVRYQEDPCLLGVVCSSTTTTAPPSPTTTRPPAGGGGGPDQPGGGDPAPAPGSPEQPAPGGQGGAPRSPSPVWAVPAGGGVTQVDDRGRRYRGVVEATGGHALRLVNQVGIEDYLRGMAEVPGTWPAAAVQAQTVAARTYALRSVQASGELCDDARCQVYVGQTAENPGQDAAVAATAGQVVTHQGALAAAVYSADAGGVSATTAEGFGTPDGVYPYLTTVRYDTDNPLPWHLEVGFPDVAARLGYPGSLTGVRVAEAGPSGRALVVALEGSAGERTVDGRRFARALGLRSTRLTVSEGAAAVAPPPPPPAEEAVQALPEETGAIAREPARPAGLARLDHLADQVRLADLPVALDPRRRRAALVLAAVALALAVGTQAPLALVPGAGLAAPLARARGWRGWRSLRRSP